MLTQQSTLEYVTLMPEYQAHPMEMEQSKLTVQYIVEQ